MNMSIHAYPLWKRIVLLIQDQFQRTGQPVSVQDLLTALAPHEEGSARTSKHLSWCLRQLEKKAILTKRQTRWGRKILTAYLPAQLSLTAPTRVWPTPLPPLVVLLAETFTTAWQERYTAAQLQGAQPTPLLVSELLARLPSAYALLLQLDQELLQRCLQSLQAANILRFVPTTDFFHTACIPVEVLDTELDFSALELNRSQRALICCRCAWHTFQRPVTGQEILSPSSLVPPFKVSLSALRADLRSLIHDSSPGLPLFSEWRLPGQDYFYYNPADPSHQAFLAWQECAWGWHQLQAATELDSLSAVPYPVLRLGRALQLQQQCVALHDKLVRSQAQASPSWQSQLTALVAEIHVLSKQIAAALRLEPTLSGLPSVIDLSLVGWHALELRAALGPFFPELQAQPYPSEINTHWSRRLRLVAPPLWPVRQSADTPALLYAAELRGGRRCQALATLVKPALGPLRDARFILPLLSAESIEERCLALSSLAFLQPDNAALLCWELACQDPELLVRETALWAYAFSDFTQATPTLQSLAANPAAPLGCLARQLLADSPWGV
jgi:hypothetical protein